MKLIAEARTAAHLPAGYVDFADASLVLRYNDVGSYVVKVFMASLDPLTAAALKRGAGMSFWDDDTGRSVLAGPITKLEQKWGDGDPYGGTLTITGVSDLIHCSDRCIYVDPTKEWEDQPGIGTRTTPWYRDSGPAESVILNMIRRNLGPGALTVRRLPGLTLPADLGRGDDVNLLFIRFNNLLETMQKCADRSDVDVAFDIVANTDLQPRVRIWVPTTKPVLLSQSGGTVRSGTTSTDAPTATRALVAGKTQSRAHPMREITDSYTTTSETTWGRRIEKVVSATLSDETISDAAEMGNAGRDAIRDGRETNLYAVTAQEGDGARFLQNYEVGDRINYEATDGVEITDVVREVTVKVTADGTTITPTVGPASASTTPTVRKRVMKLERAVRDLYAQDFPDPPA